MLKFNLPQAWVIAIDCEEMEMNDRTILVPSFAGAKISDAIFICDPDSGFVQYECTVKNASEDYIELLLIHAVEEHPWLSVDSLVENDILPSQFTETGIVQLSQTATIQLKTLFNNPNRYQ